MNILHEHLTRILDECDIQKEELNFPQGEVQLWSFSGGAVKWISLAEGAKVSINMKGYPDVIVGIGASAGGLEGLGKLATTEGVAFLGLKSVSLSSAPALLPNRQLLQTALTNPAIILLKVC